MKTFEGSGTRRPPPVCGGVSPSKESVGGGGTDGVGRLTYPTLWMGEVVFWSTFR